jgi:hypothetical protein
MSETERRDAPEGVFVAGDDPTDTSRTVRRTVTFTDGADGSAARAEVLELPGVRRAALVDGAPELVVDLQPDVLSDEELDATLRRAGLEAFTWSDGPLSGE